MNKIFRWLKRHNSKNRKTLKVGINITRCSECEKYNKGTELYNMFSQDRVGFLLKYDRANETFIVNENTLMHAIQLVSPAQQPRKLKLVTAEEWRSFRNQ